MLSGGYDHHMKLMDISKLLCVYDMNVKDVIGSVRYLPGNPHVCSCTTDIGAFIVYDTRTRERVTTIDTHQPLMYTHAYQSRTCVVLGYGWRPYKQQIAFYDLRKNDVVSSFVDENMCDIGDIQFVNSHKDGRQHMVCFGSPGATFSRIGGSLQEGYFNRKKLFSTHPLIKRPNYDGMTKEQVIAREETRLDKAANDLNCSGVCDEWGDRKVLIIAITTSEGNLQFFAPEERLTSHIPVKQRSEGRRRRI